MNNFPTDIEIAQKAKKKPIQEISAKLGVSPEELITYGNDKAKIHYDCLDRLGNKPDGKLILVTAISPTPAGEGKTTTSVGLVDGLCDVGEKAMVCLREPSLGPCFGMKGGAAGGGAPAAPYMGGGNLLSSGQGGGGMLGLTAGQGGRNLLSAGRSRGASPMDFTQNFPSYNKWEPTMIPPYAQSRYNTVQQGFQRGNWPLR